MPHGRFRRVHDAATAATASGRCRRWRGWWPGSTRLGDILSAAFEIYKANAFGLLMIVAIVVVPLTFISAFLGGVVFAPETHTETIFGQTVEVSTRSATVGIFAALIGVVIAVIISAVLQAALIRGAAQASIGDAVDIEASYKWGFARFGSVLLISILVGLAVLGGLILFIIPGLILIVMFAVAIPALVVENRKGTEAMGRSWNLVKGHFWHVVVVILVAAIIAGVVSGIINGIGTAISDNWFVTWVFQAIGQIIVAPFSALVAVLLYVDLRARSEALTADDSVGNWQRTPRDLRAYPHDEGRPAGRPSHEEVNREWPPSHRLHRRRTRAARAVTPCPSLPSPLGSIIGRAFSTLGEHWKPLLGISAVFTAISFVAGLLIGLAAGDTADPDTRATIVVLVGTGLYFIVWMAMTGALTRLVASEVAGAPSGVAERASNTASAIWDRSSS